VAKMVDSAVEGAAAGWKGDLGYEVLSGLAIAPGESASERSDYDEVVKPYIGAFHSSNSACDMGKASPAFGSFCRQQAFHLVFLWTSVLNPCDASEFPV